MPRSKRKTGAIREEQIKLFDKVKPVSPVLSQIDMEGRVMGFDGSYLIIQWNKREADLGSIQVGLTPRYRIKREGVTKI